MILRFDCLSKLRRLSRQIKSFVNEKKQQLISTTFCLLKWRSIISPKVENMFPGFHHNLDFIQLHCTHTWTRTRFPARITETSFKPNHHSIIISFLPHLILLINIRVFVSEKYFHGFVKRKQKVKKNK